MKTDKGSATVRRERLRQLVAEVSQSDLGKAAKMSLSQIGQWLSGERNISEASARRLEKAARKPVGWLDGSVPTDLKVGYDIEGNGQPETARPYPSGNRIPVVGSALLGDNGHFVELEYPVGHGDGWVSPWPIDHPESALADRQPAHGRSAEPCRRRLRRLERRSLLLGARRHGRHRRYHDGKIHPVALTNVSGAARAPRR